MTANWHMLKQMCPKPHLFIYQDQALVKATQAAGRCLLQQSIHVVIVLRRDWIARNGEFDMQDIAADELCWLSFAQGQGACTGSWSSSGGCMKAHSIVQCIMRHILSRCPVILACNLQPQNAVQSADLGDRRSSGDMDIWPYTRTGSKTRNIVLENIY